MSYAFAVDAADQWVSQIDDDASHCWGQCRAIYLRGFYNRQWEYFVFEGLGRLASSGCFWFMSRKELISRYD